MKKIWLYLLIILSKSSLAQIILSEDTSICGTQNLNLYAISASVDSLVTDDTYTSSIKLGFDFEFYGNTYDHILISSNGYVTFDTTNSGGYSPWAINMPIPNPGTPPENSILVTWQDTDPAVAGAIYFGSYGASPNKVYVVTWCGLAMFSCNNLIYTSQLRLYEGSNKIEMYLQDKPLCASWNAGAAVQGLVDINSANFDIVNDPVQLLDRNFPLNWTATNEGWEFIPNGPSSYNINSIPFVSVAAGLTTWTDNYGNIVGYGDSINIMPQRTTTYYAKMNSQCSGTIIDSITINVSSGIESNLATENTSCYGNDGKVTVSPDFSTSSPPWNINILDKNGNNIQNQQNVFTYHVFNGLFPGSYIAQIIDPINGCSGTKNFTINQDSVALQISINKINVSCYNGSDGEISVQVVNGSPPYKFFLNNQISTNPYPYDSVFSSLVAGSHILTVTDNNNCSIRDTVFLSSPLQPTRVISQSKVSVCFDSFTGSINAFGSGGTPPYSYEWFNFGDSVAFSLSNSVDSLPTGSYFVEVMDANGCDTFTTVQVITSQLPLTASPQVYGVSCRGDSTGKIIADGGGSSPPYKYYWKDSNGDTLQYTGYMMGRDTLDNLPSGSYRLHIYDSQECFEDYILTVGEPSTSLKIDTLLVVSDISCYGDSVGSARMYVSGGMPNYSYVWESGEVDLIARSLKSGYNTVSVTDDWGCTVEDSIQINENPLIESTVSVVQNVSCYGNSDGIASISTSGGVASYTYFWSNGQVGLSTPDTASNLLFGSYYVTTRDALGCEVVDSIDISQPEPLLMEASEIDWISCYGANDGLASAYAWGGTPPYTFTWLTGGQQGDTINTLTPGVHTVFVSDAKGCISSDTVFINEPAELFVDIVDTTLAYCIGINTASLTAVASGGTPGYSYQWDDNTIAPQTTAIATDLLAGIYTIMVTDSRGCVVTASIDIDTVTNTMSAQITALNHYNGGHYVSCYGANDGKVFVNAYHVNEPGDTSLAYEPYSYQWSGPSGFSSSNDTINHLFAGIYSVEIVDTNGCRLVRSIYVTEPLNLSYSIHSSTAETCFGSCDGTVSLSQLRGGTAPYTGIFTNDTTGYTGSSTILVDSTGHILIPDVCSGSHTITLTDANGCASTIISGGSNRVVVPFALRTTASIDPSSVVNILCNSSATGSASALNPVINDSNYSYSWQNINNPGITIVRDTIVSNLLAGTYVLLAHYSDSNNSNLIYPGCTSSDTVTISELPAVEISSNGIVAVDCFGKNTGSISTSVLGGTPPYVYEWLPIGGTTPVANNLGAGVYTLKILDANQCSDIDTFSVSQPNALNVSISESNYLLSISSLSGGVSPYTYSWRESSSPSVAIQGGTSFLVTQGGTYYVIVIDANGCIQTSNSVLFNETSIKESEMVKIKIYPNPFRDEATIDIGRSVSEVVVRVMDIYGKIIEIREERDINKVIINSANKAKGTYFVEIEIDKDQIYYEKITVN